MIPEGRHVVRPVSAELGQTKSGKEQVRVRFRADDGNEISWFGGFASDKAVAYSVGVLRTCGWKGDDLSVIDLAAEPVEVVVQSEEYNGRMQAKVKYVNPLNKTPQMAADKAKAFAAKMLDKVRSVSKDATPAAADQEIPF